MKAYPAYKESSIGWIGEIPLMWKQVQLKFLAENHDNKRIPVRAEDRGNMQGDYPYYGATGIIDYVNDYLFDGEHLLIGEDGAPFFLQADVAFIAKGKFWVNNHAHILRASKDANLRFMKHALNSVDFREYITGSTRDKLTQTDLARIVLPTPSIPEQRAIADFLDRKTAQIDTLIEKKQRQIELLQEQRAALINQAVTKGLDPNVPMKDSGIEWLGEIPNHWEVVRLKHISPNISVGLVIQPSKYVDPKGTIPFLYGGNVGENEFYLDGVRKITEESNKKISNSMLHTGDLVTVRVGYPGITAVIPPSLNNCNCTSMMIVRKSGFVLSEYLCYSMNSYVGMYQIGLVEYGAAQKQFNISHAIDFVYPIPPKDEQEKIVEYLNKRESTFKQAKEKLQNQFELLQEYRTALISAAVTGKVDVREETGHE